MMCIQTPGSFVFVYSLFVRPGVNWTAWGVYLISESASASTPHLFCLPVARPDKPSILSFPTWPAGLLQGVLLVMCLAWSVRQK